MRRSGADANSRTPSSNPTLAVNPSSARARSVSANTWRTSPSRYPPTTSGAGAPVSRRARQCLGKVEDGPGCATGDVERAGHRRVGGQREHVGARHVAHVDEVASLSPVLEHFSAPGRPRARCGRSPPLRHTACREACGRRRRCGTAGRSPAPMLAAEDEAQMLLVHLRGRVHVARVGGRVLGNRLRHQRAATRGAARIPLAALEAAPGRAVRAGRARASGTGTGLRRTRPCCSPARAVPRSVARGARPAGRRCRRRCG